MNEEQLEAYVLTGQSLEMLRKSESAHIRALNLAEEKGEEVDRNRKLYELARDAFERIK